MLNTDVLWNAVLGRDANWDAAFVYGVTSTGIFCRPTCPSRRPKRERVRFFPTADAAAAGGFRPCRRCRPSAPRAIEPSLARVRRACELLARPGGDTLSLDRLAHAVGGSPHHLQRTFTKLLGISPREYADAWRIGCLKVNLRAGAGVASATYESGYGSGSRVYERADAVLGMTPAAYARGGSGHEVRYVTSAAPLGRLLVAATGKGICSVKLGASDDELIAELRREYPHATVAAADHAARRWIQDIVCSLAPGSPDPRLPLDVRATAFQRRVWRELQRIPKGETRTYKDVAARVAQPRGARAVARACATNPVALVVPCHRVVPASGGTGGYRWGAERKRRLLEGETVR